MKKFLILADEVNWVSCPRCYKVGDFRVLRSVTQITLTDEVSNGELTVEFTPAGRKEERDENI